MIPTEGFYGFPKGMQEITLTHGADRSCILLLWMTELPPSANLQSSQVLSLAGCDSPRKIPEIAHVSGGQEITRTDTQNVLSPEESPRVKARSEQEILELASMQKRIALAQKRMELQNALITVGSAQYKAMRLLEEYGKLQKEEEEIPQKEAFGEEEYDVFTQYLEKNGPEYSQKRNLSRSP